MLPFAFALLLSFLVALVAEVEGFSLDALVMLATNFSRAEILSAREGFCKINASYLTFLQKLPHTNSTVESKLRVDNFSPTK